jgi:hypothetical protein
MKKIRRPTFQWIPLFAALVGLIFLWEFFAGPRIQNPWLRLPPFVAVMALAVAFFYLRARRRIETLRRLSGELGLTFAKKGDENSMPAFYDPVDPADARARLEELMKGMGAAPEAKALFAARLATDLAKPGLKQNALAGLTLFQQVDDKRMHNVMSGRLAGAEAAVFDYTYSTRLTSLQKSTPDAAKPSPTSASQTVAVFRFRDRKLPLFELSREGKILKAEGHDIDFPTHPIFSRRFHLRGDDESAIRNLFDGGVLGFFEQLPDDFSQIVEAAGECIAVYRPGRVVNPEAVKSFVEQAAAIASTFGSARRNFTRATFA